MSFFRYENILLNQNGTPLVNVNVWVCTGIITPNFFTIPPGPLATVYSDTLGTQPITQPILTSPLGNYSFCAAPGTYTVVFVSTGLQSSDIVTVPSVVNQTIEVDGVQYTTLFQAMSALPASGGTIDMRGNSSTAALALSTGFTSGIVDPGTKAVTILLGPYTYNFTQIVLRRALRIVGAAAYPANGTIINATGGNSTPAFTMDQVTPTQDIQLEHFAITGTAGNTSQICFNLTGTVGGLWYSNFNDIFVTGFGGVGLNLDGHAPGVAHQFNTFDRLVILRPTNGDNALKITGFANSLRFANCEFDGQLSTNDGHTNILIQDASGASFVPYDIQFDLVTCQFAGVGIQISGCAGVEINQGHFEGCSGAIQVTDGTANHSLGVMIQNCFFGNGTGVNSGNGFIINQTTANSSVTAGSLMVFGVPDTVFKGTVVNTPQWGIFVSTNPVPLNPALGSTTGFGTGAAGTAVTTTLKGGGTGPATPQTIVKYQAVTVNGATFWIPLVQ